MAKPGTPEYLRGHAVHEAEAGRFAMACQLAGQAVAGFVRDRAFEEAHKTRMFQGRLAQQAGDLGLAQDVLRAGLHDARRRGSDRQACEAMTELGGVLELAGDLREAVALHREVMASRQGTDDGLVLAIAKGNVARLVTRLAPAERRREAQQEARSLLLEAGELFVTHGRPGYAAQVLVTLGDQERTEGNLEAARQAFADALAVAERAGHLPVLPMALLNLGLVLRDLGRTADARQRFDEAATVAVKLGDRLQLARIHLAQAMTDADRLPPADVAALFAGVEAEFNAIGQSAGGLPARANRAAALARAGRYSQSLAVTRKLRAQLWHAGDRLGAVEVDIAVCELLLSMGDRTAFEVAFAALRCADLPPRFGQRLNLLAARQALRALDLAAADRALRAAVADEPTRSTRFSAALARAQFDMVCHRATALDDLAGLLQQSADSPRDAAAVHTSLCDTLAWFGHRDRALHHGREAVRRLRDFGEPLAVASASCSLALAGLGLAAFDGVDTTLVGESPDIVTCLAAARATVSGDELSARTQTARLISIGNLACAVWLARMSCSDPTFVQMSDIEAELMTRAIADGPKNPAPRSGDAGP
ncbi:MAG: tetratricopeptide repeat protein [Deltaproteobacteria bacterium]|nr:tetratricopeptide repeat protein [Deltaproteobacteria bacterium]